jgi:fused signal recognition particle receptor
MSFFDRLKEGLTKTKQGFVGKVETIFKDRDVDEETLEELEETLILSDIGASGAREIIERLREKSARGEVQKAGSVKDFLKKEMALMLGSPQPLVIYGERPFVILTVGVNGVGKTTTIGKAAIEQLEIWAERTHAQFVKHQSGSDPSAVVFDAIEAAKSRNIDVVIIDTAGRLHTKSPLMEELKKVKRVCGKAMEGSPHEIILVVDATNGQNALRQAQMFNDTLGITGIALTKLDGTAKGGIVFAIKKDQNISIKLIGIGESVDDLQDFVPDDFVRALFE